MDYSLSTKWILFFLMIISTAVIKSVNSQSQILNTPPVVSVDRDWRISETEKTGSVIARVRAQDAENDPLIFDLEPLFHGNYANPNNEGNTNNNLPFQIDPHTGIVRLNESLSGRGGENFFLYVTVFDGQLTAKNEISVNIYAENDDKIYDSRPSIPPIGRNISQFFPLFGLLPGVQSMRNHPNNLRPPGIPPQIFNTLPPPHIPVDINSNVYYPVSKKPEILVSTTLHKTSEKDKEETQNDEETGSKSSNTRTKLTPIKTISDKPTVSLTDSKNKSDNRKEHSLVEKDGRNIINENSISGQVEKSEDPLSVKAVIPVIITICGIFLAATLIAVVIFRKHLCAIGKSLKKKSKEEMVKKSNQSNISSNITDDSRNSMVLQHWSGPLAFNNRYVPWERDNQQLSLVTSQLSTSSSTGGGNGCNTQSSKTDPWEFPRHRLKFFNILGEGAFGQVWRCEATDIDGNEGVTTVAVKTLKENAAEVERNDLHSELMVMKSLEPHVNVVRFLGCCTDKDPIFVIIEYVNRGKLQTYLRNSRAERHYGNTHGKSNILTSGDLTSFMYQVAKGMDYLTSRGIIHRDLAARNILITDDHTCKIADFGFARDVIMSKIYERKSEGKLPIRWMAIESLYDNIFSVKSDIWSFGILMWEIVTLGSTPYPGISAADVMRKVKDGYRLEKPEHCRRELYNIMYYCWAKDASERPSFSEIVLMLDKLLHTEMDYIELERFPDHNYYNILNLSGEKL